MIDFELKIFANPSGFKELQLNNTQELFTQDLVLLRAYDAERDTFKAGAYSVFFTPACYIVSYQFDVPNEVNFRGASAILAIAIRRGKKLNDIISVFTDLRGKINRALVEVGSTSIHIKLNEFNETIQQHIQDDVDQMFINSTSPINIKRALVGYKTLEQLKHLLEVPNRRQFIGYNLVFLVPQVEAAQIWDSIKDKYSAITFNDSEFEYQTSYEVVFPDGHSEIVSDRNSEVNYTAQKPYHHNLNFNGRLSDNWGNWEISPSEDKTRFIIGKKFKPCKQAFVVRLHDGDGSLLSSQNIVLKSNIGTYNSYNKELILIGEDIEKRSLVKLTPEAANRKIALQKWEGDEYAIRFTKMYHYDFTSILQNIKIQHGEEGIITLFSKSKNEFLASFTVNSTNQDLDIPFEETYITIETKTTERTGKIFLQLDGSLKGKITLKKKEAFRGFTNYGRPSTPTDIKLDIVKVIFKIKDQKIEKKALNLTLKCTTGGKTGSTFYKSNQAIIRPFSRKQSNDMSYTVTIKGYKPIEGTVSFDNVDETITIPLNFELTSGKKKVRKLLFLSPLFLLFLLMGFGIGWFVSPSKTAKNSDDELKKLEELLSSKNSIINELKSKYDLLKKTATEAKVFEKPVQGMPNIDHQKKIELESKLNGLEFTKEDINLYKKKYGQNRLTQDCEACLTIIDAKMKPYTDKKGNKQDPLGFAQKTLLNCIIIQSHKDAIKKFIDENGEFYNIIKSKSKDTNYKTIQNAINAYSEQNY